MRTSCGANCISPASLSHDTRSSCVRVRAGVHAHVRLITMGVVRAQNVEITQAILYTYTPLGYEELSACAMCLRVFVCECARIHLEQFIEPKVLARNVSSLELVATLK